MVLILNKKIMLVFVTFFLIFAIIASCTKFIAVGSPKTKYTIVIDAGHGGLDVK